MGGVGNLSMLLAVVTSLSVMGMAGGVLMVLVAGGIGIGIGIEFGGLDSLFAEPPPPSVFPALAATSWRKVCLGQAVHSNLEAQIIVQASLQPMLYAPDPFPPLT